MLFCLGAFSFFGALAFLGLSGSGGALALRFCFGLPVGVVPPDAVTACEVAPLVLFVLRSDASRKVANVRGDRDMLGSVVIVGFAASEAFERPPVPMAEVEGRFVEEAERAIGM